MRGRILDLNRADGRGVLVGADGNRYSFALPDWRAPGLPLPGAQVDFVVEAGGLARDIFLLPGQVTASFESVPIAPADNSVVLGWIGVACLALGFFVPLLPWIASFITGMMAADGAKRTGNGTGLVLGRLAWIGSLVLFLLALAVVVIGISFLWPIFEAALKQAPSLT